VKAKTVLQLLCSNAVDAGVSYRPPDATSSTVSL
jgi:hypothetical protein